MGAGSPRRLGVQRLRRRVRRRRLCPTARRTTGGRPGGGAINCASRNYQQEFCPTGPISGATLVLQRSQAQCIQGQTWGVRSDGIWVSGGCDGDFQVQAGGYYAPAPLPAPTRPGLFVCESRNYGYNFCPTVV